MVTLLKKALVYGCLGILVEFFFTSIESLIFGDWNATGQSFLWMVPIYGFTALALEAVSKAIKWPFYFKALLYVPIIYGVEALSGWTIQCLIGTIPWDYKHSVWSPMGLINFKYAPFWLGLAMMFDYITLYLNKALRAFSSVIE